MSGKGFVLGEAVADGAVAVEGEVGEAHFAVAARAGAAEAVPFEQLQSGEQGVQQGVVVAVVLFEGEAEGEDGVVS